MFTQLAEASGVRRSAGPLSQAVAKCGNPLSQPGNRPDLGGEGGAMRGEASIEGTSGFTLVEVLLAMCIVCIGLLAVGGMQLSAIQANQSARKDDPGQRLGHIDHGETDQRVPLTTKSWIWGEHEDPENPRGQNFQCFLDRIGGAGSANQENPGRGRISGQANQKIRDARLSEEQPGLVYPMIGIRDRLRAGICLPTGRNRL